jgi:hypothetical protein
MANPLPRLDRLIRRVDNASTWDVLSGVAGSRGPMAAYAQEVLTAPRAAATTSAIDEFLKANEMRIDRPIGRGRESMVFSVRGADNQIGNVLKLQSVGAGRGFTLPVGVPGVAGYWAKDRLGPGTLVALQAKADRVLPPDVRAKWGGIAEESRWSGMADAVQRSLAARGMTWTDPHAGNIGIMPDGNMSALDGAVIPSDSGDVLPENLRMSVEDAIRLLRAPVK